LAAVEIMHPAGSHVCGANRQPRLAALDAREIDELEKCPLQRGGRVTSGAVRAEHHMGSAKGQGIGFEEAGDTPVQRVPQGQGLRKVRPSRKSVPDRLVRHAPPEILERRQAPFRLVASNQASIDGTNGGADDPVWLYASFVQSLIDAGLIGAERAA